MTNQGRASQWDFELPATDRDLLPIESGINKRGCLMVGGCDVTELAERFGTPLYIFDEWTLRSTCREWLRAFQSRYEHTLVLYAAKAFMNLSLARIVKEEGLGIDVASLGEIGFACAADFPADRVFVHGNNKSAEELELAVRRNLAAIVTDNLYELELLAEIVARSKQKVPILIRVNPNVDPHTHKHITTGALDSKFGLPIETGQAEEAIARSLKVHNLEVAGIHFHLGSQVLTLDPYREAIVKVLDFCEQMKRKHGFNLRLFSPGGGFGVRYSHEKAPTPDETAEAVVRVFRSELTKKSLGTPALIIEMGRSIVARSGVAVYRVGAIKDIPGTRKYVSVDGGLADNIRPALYGSRYTGIVANKANAPDTQWVRVVGKYCESSDILLPKVKLPVLEPGDLIAMPMCGAYAPAMASNYNLSFKPAIVMVRSGNAWVIRRRETMEDLLRLEQDA